MTIGQPQNSHPDEQLIDDLATTLLVANEFFSVYKWEIDGQASFEQVAPYYLVSVVEGQGSLVVAGQSYPLKKGQHFILPTPVKEWTLSGQLELIVSHIAEN